MGSAKTILFARANMRAREFFLFLPLLNNGCCYAKLLVYKAFADIYLVSFFYFASTLLLLCLYLASTFLLLFLYLLTAQPIVFLTSTSLPRRFQHTFPILFSLFLLSQFSREFTD